jgi:dGTPase
LLTLKDEKLANDNLSDYYRITSSAKALEEQECKTLASYALKAEERRNRLKKKFREYRPNAPLEHRTAYHRDRDRILWSKAFKRLQHKTQVFPHYVEDHYKRRLTHSLEVSQIATTVARALNLNEAATEAIAIGHDLGHTPFGHAGEQALNKILTLKLKDMDPEIRGYLEKLKKRKANKIVPIFGFDHCVHAIEVVSRTEKEYASETNHGGFNLTFDVRDGMLKHMCERTTVKEKQERPFSNIAEITKFDKYKSFGANKGSLEAQCVYFADKVTYLLGDIEDGVRCDILECKELDDHAFIKKFLGKYYKKYRKSDLQRLNKTDFPLFRSNVLTTLILNCINTAKNNIEKSKIKNVDEVLSNDERIVFLSDDLKKSWTYFYQEWMVNKLFKNDRVVACSFKAEKIVTDLFNAYFENQGLIDSKYYEHCLTVYKEMGISDEKLLNLIIARNYIAGMTDPFASDQHARLYMPLERIRF